MGLNDKVADAARVIARVGLSEHIFDSAGSLPLGKQRIVEIARALAADPILLLLDEPAAGLRYREKRELAELLRALKAQGITILLVEHDMDFVMGLTDRLVVMDFGEKIAEGRPEQVQDDPLVMPAHDPLGFVEVPLRHIIEHPVVESEKQGLELRDDDVFVVPLVADERSACEQDAAPPAERVPEHDERSDHAAHLQQEHHGQAVGASVLSPKSSAISGRRLRLHAAPDVRHL